MRAIWKSACLTIVLLGTWSEWTAAADIWECADGGVRHFTNINPGKPHYLCPSRDNPKARVVMLQGGPGCQHFEKQPPGVCQRHTVMDPTPAAAAPALAPHDPISSFRDNLKMGDRTSAGLVIELRPPIARVQTSTNERWFRIDELNPPRLP